MAWDAAERGRVAFVEPSVDPTAVRRTGCWLAGIRAPWSPLTEQRQPRSPPTTRSTNPMLCTLAKLQTTASRPVAF